MKRKSDWKEVSKDAFDVGQTVKLTGSHPFAGCIGTIISIERVMGRDRPRVRLHDMGDHEVFVMTDSDAKVLK